MTYYSVESYDNGEFVIVSHKDKLTAAKYLLDLHEKNGWEFNIFGKFENKIVEEPNPYIYVIKTPLEILDEIIAFSDMSRETISSLKSLISAMPKDFE